MSDKDMDASDEELGVLVKDPTQWCQTEHQATDESNRTKLIELPYHNWATPSRSLNPDNGLTVAFGGTSEGIVSAAETEVVPAGAHPTALDSVGRSLSQCKPRAVSEAHDAAAGPPRDECADYDGEIAVGEGAGT